MTDYEKLATATLAECIDYNAQVVALAAFWAGNVRVAKDAKAFVKELQKITDKTNEKRKVIMEAYGGEAGKRPGESGGENGNRT